MARPHARAARRERQAADLLGSRRVLRARYESAPDVEPVTLPCGVRLTVEVKTRAKLPKIVTSALLQAAKYGDPGDVPCVVMSETGGEPLAVLPLRAFRRIAGIESPADSAKCAKAVPASPRSSNANRLSDRETVALEPETGGIECHLRRVLDPMGAPRG